jgi:hypothetical protein
MTCPDCSGTGKITLFTSAKPCKACGGTGKVGAVMTDFGIASGTITATSWYDHNAYGPPPGNPNGYLGWHDPSGHYLWHGDKWQKIA